eukprot:TRINITY_DN64549_c0_g1_i1.p1 TRINITY_DN64549_c0_g1~~TRINITY_DN64549_c0_g1_i1.p1  ORF type:complete len:405 (+),score=75.20 TRINITY_DN64549_c0_g1_i1:129-1217(+)
MVLGLKRKMDLWELAQEKWRSDLEQKITTAVVKRLEGGILEKCIEKLRDQVLGLLVSESTKANGLQTSPRGTEVSRNPEAGGEEPLASSPGRSNSRARSPSIKKSGTAPLNSLMGSLKRIPDASPNYSLTLPNSARVAHSSDLPDRACGGSMLVPMQDSKNPRAPQKQPLPGGAMTPTSPTRQASSPQVSMLQASPSVVTRQFSLAVPMLYNYTADARGQIADGQGLGVRPQVLVRPADPYEASATGARSSSTIRDNMSSLRREMAEQRAAMLQPPGSSLVPGAASVPVPHALHQQQMPAPALMQQHRQRQMTPQMVHRPGNQSPASPRRYTADPQAVPMFAQQMQSMRHTVHAPSSPWSAS